MPEPALAVEEPAVPTDVPAEDAQTLNVGRGIRLVAKVCECDGLTIEGHLEATAQAKTIVVTQGGRFIGNAEVEEADIAGCVEGNLTVSKRLTIRPTGSVSGTTRYQEIVIEAGGQILGTSQCLDGASEGTAPAAEPDEQNAMAG
jgi:cytoskeletal protein CcmA (bactofilin family)